MFGISFSFFRNRTFCLKIYRMRLKWYYCLRFLKKLECYGLLQNYMGNIEKIHDSFQFLNNWQFFCSMPFKHSKGRTAQDFWKVSNFFFSWRNKTVFKTAWFFLKADTIVKFILGSVPNIAFIQEFSKRKRSKFRIPCEYSWVFARKDLNFFKAATHGLFFFQKVFQVELLFETPQRLQNLGFFGKNDMFFSEKSLKLFKIAKIGNFSAQCVSKHNIAQEVSKRSIFRLILEKQMGFNEEVIEISQNQ